MALERRFMISDTADLAFKYAFYFFISPSLSSSFLLGFLDPEKKLFSHRILSRDECIDPFSKTGNLRWELHSAKDDN